MGGGGGGGGGGGKQLEGLQDLGQFFKWEARRPWNSSGWTHVQSYTF